MAHSTPLPTGTLAVLAINDAANLNSEANPNIEMTSEHCSTRMLLFKVISVWQDGWWKPVINQPEFRAVPFKSHSDKQKHMVITKADQKQWFEFSNHCSNDHVTEMRVEYWWI